MYNIIFYRGEDDGRLTLDKGTNEYEVAKIISIEERPVLNVLLLVSAHLLRRNAINNEEYKQLTVACSKDDIYTRQLTHEECEEVIKDTHRFIHDVLELDEFNIVDDEGKILKTFKWFQRGKIFVDQDMLNNK